MSGAILWRGQPVPFQPGESVASALSRAGHVDLGIGPSGLPRAMFCGIGQCQNCLVRVGGRLVEACLTPCADALPVWPETEGENG